MPSSMPEQREIDATASKTFTRWFLIAFGIAALLGLSLGLVWVIAGLLNFHFLR
jgi:hypothetical protein